MPKVTTVGGWSHASDAAFRIYVAEFEQMLEDSGLVRTADTGQINPATVVRAGTNSDAGYSMWRFDDSLQSIAPVFIKLTYGTSSSAIRPRATISIGSATDGAGNFSGTHFTPPLMCSPGQDCSASSTLSSFACHTEGLAFFLPKYLGLASTSSAVPHNFCVQRTVNSTGAPTAEGVVLTTPSSNGFVGGYARVCRLTYSPSPVTWAEVSGAYQAIMPMSLSDSRVGLQPQVLMHWTALPKILPLAGSASYIDTEISFGSEFSMALVGATARNYKAFGSYSFNNTAYLGANYGTALLWED